MATHFGSSPHWRRVRAVALAREPLCHWCGERPSTEGDHIVPRAHGGTDTLENVVGSCRPCNLARGADVRHRPERKPW